MNDLLPLPHFSVFCNETTLIAYAIIGEESWRSCLGFQTTEARQLQRGLAPLGGYLLLISVYAFLGGVTSHQVTLLLSFALHRGAPVDHVRRTC